MKRSTAGTHNTPREMAHVRRTMLRRAQDSRVAHDTETLSKSRKERKAALRRTPSPANAPALRPTTLQACKQPLPHPTGPTFPPTPKIPSPFPWRPSPPRHLEPWLLPLLPTHLGSGWAGALINLLARSSLSQTCCKNDLSISLEQSCSGTWGGC